MTISFPIFSNDPTPIKEIEKKQGTINTSTPFNVHVLNKDSTQPHFVGKVNLGGSNYAKMPLTKWVLNKRTNDAHERFNEDNTFDPIIYNYPFRVLPVVYLHVCRQRAIRVPRI